MTDRRSSVMAGLAIVIALFCVPLFVNLGGLDLRNDEPIYAYSVNRILETGEWLTPRSIQVDGPFLEKPPLKVWLVAALIRTGLVSNDEFGMRFLDALMGTIGFVYVYLLGVRLAGPLCGVASVLTLFTIDWMVFDHGLRSNNMEAPLFLTYCGAMYHFSQWVDRRRRRHAFAVCAWFVLGFMTKFVAALFFPIIVALSLVTIPIVRLRMRASWRDWVVPILLSAAAIAPWFIYETITFGASFWQVILGEHVYTRFTGALDPTHLQPWDFYFSSTWAALTSAQSRAIVVAGGGLLLFKAWQGEPWQMRLILAWWLVPYALMSAGTSKLIHYAYPFLPPIGLAGGWFCATVWQLASGPSAGRFAKALGRFGGKPPGIFAARARFTRAFLMFAAAVAFVLAIVTGINGPVIWRTGATTIFQNSSVVRPIFVAAVFLALAGFGTVALRPTAALILAFGLPLATYPAKAFRVMDVDHRWRSVRDCATMVGNAGGVGAGIHAIGSLQTHVPYYYLYRLGPWTEGRDANDPETRTRLSTAGRQTLVVMTTPAYTTLDQIASGAGWTEPLPGGVVIDGLVTLMPGPFQRCIAPAIGAGAMPVAVPRAAESPAQRIRT
jgi:4-amino-4-deoxy-L-arabinose transferase-like glycosyltransferase